MKTSVKHGYNMLIGSKLLAIAVCIMDADDTMHYMAGNQLKQLTEYRLSGKQCTFTHVTIVEVVFDEATQGGSQNLLFLFMLFLPDNNNQRLRRTEGGINYTVYDTSNTALAGNFINQVAIDLQRNKAI